jgi:hypothetical protein
LFCCQQKSDKSRNLTVKLVLPSSFVRCPVLRPVLFCTNISLYTVAFRICARKSGRLWIAANSDTILPVWFNIASAAFRLRPRDHKTGNEPLVLQRRHPHFRQVRVAVVDGRHPDIVPLRWLSMASTTCTGVPRRAWMVANVRRRSRTVQCGSGHCASILFFSRLNDETLLVRLRYCLRYCAVRRLNGNVLSRLFLATLAGMMIVSPANHACENRLTSPTRCPVSRQSFTMSEYGGAS